jgi:hypothetical protein
MRYKTQTAKRGYVIRIPQGTELAHENATKDPKREPEGEPPDLKMRIGISTCLEPELDSSLAPRVSTMRCFV